MRVLVFGGTHGNEWTGITVVTQYAKALKKKFPQLDLHFILANPEAHKLGKRFKDEDLNRAFQFLHEDRSNSYEHNRANEIKQIIDEAPCFVIDLHTTTSHMGSTVIVTHYNPLNLDLSAKLSTSLLDCRIIGSPDPERKYLGSQSEHGLMIEVGPVANNLVEATSLKATLEILESILTYLSDQHHPLTGSIEIFEEVEDVYYPVDKEEKITAFIHKDFQGQDFRPVKDKFTAFESFNGEKITCLIKEELYPIFINEAAYYPQKLAFSLCRKLNKDY